MAKLEDIVTPLVQFEEGDAADTPASGLVRIYAKSDGLLYSKDDAGAETLMSGSDTSGLLDETAHDLLDHTGLTGCGIAVTNGKEVVLDSTNETTIATRTPAAAGNVLVGIYFRVITGTTNVTVKVTYTDATGAQTNTLLNAQACAVGSYSLPMMMINTTAAAIAVKITAGTANQVYGSAVIMEVS